MQKKEIKVIHLSNRAKNYSLKHDKLCLSGGAAGAVSRITGALGKGIATLTLDDDYQRKRREQMAKKPTDLKEGLARGGKGLVMVSTIHFVLANVIRCGGGVRTSATQCFSSVRFGPRAAVSGATYISHHDLVILIVVIVTDTTSPQPLRKSVVHLSIQCHS